MRLVRSTFALLVVGSLMAWAPVSPALAANVVNATIHTPADVQINPCSPGDIVNLNGDIHIVITTTANGRDGYRVKNHLNAQLSGVSITTGTRYVSAGTNNEQWSTGTSFPAVYRATYGFLLVSQESTPNYVLHMTVRETVDSQGATAVAADQWSISCRGRG